MMENGNTSSGNESESDDGQRQPKNNVDDGPQTNDGLKKKGGKIGPPTVRDDEQRPDMDNGPMDREQMADDADGRCRMDSAVRLGCGQRCIKDEAR